MPPPRRTVCRRCAAEGPRLHVRAWDAGLPRLLDRRLPSPDALHDFLARFHDEAQPARHPAAGAWFPAESPTLRPLGELSTAMIRRAVTGLAAAALDLDATTILSHKRDAFPLDTGGR